jgi:hypothetical protein
MWKNISKMLQNKIKRQFSEEHKRNLSLSHIGIVYTQERNQKIRDNAKNNLHYGNKGKKFSQEHKEKLSVSHKGKKLSEQTKQKMSEEVKKRWENPEFRKKNKGSLGMKHSEEYKNKMSLRSKGKSFEEIFGSEKVNRIKDNLKLNHKGMLGLHLSEEHKQKISFANKGEKHAQWKGEDACANVKHLYVRKIKPMPLLCENCKEEKKLTLANIKSHDYTKKPEDYVYWCYQCHSDYDLFNRQLKKLTMKDGNEQ